MRPETDHASTVAAAFDQRAATYDDSALHRDLADAVARFATAAGARTVLDVATGTGLVLRTFASRGVPARLIGADISAGMLEVARAALPGGRFLQASADRLPVANGAVDLVTCVTAMHLMAEPEAALAEFARVLAAGGRLVLATFQQAPDRSCADRPYRTIHPRFATTDLVAREAAPAGFAVSRSETGTYGEQHCLLTELTS
jgi:ubiquinone/menaquinone biosynthesis C-methylase UbiE